MNGILVDTQRMSNIIELTLPLAELEVVDRESGNYQLVDDYCVWFENNG